VHLVEARGLQKAFDDFLAVKGIDVHVNEGEVFGFLGPNGAGKSSTMRMVGCVSTPTAGQLTIFGLDPARDGHEIRARLGVVPQEDNLDTELSVRENLIIYGRYFGIPRATLHQRVDELLEFVQLEDRADSRVDPLSGGMKRRLTIARALVNEPEMLLLDEPTTGLDPQARHLVWERLYQLKQQGVTQVLTTHYMDEAERLCDRLVIMDDGLIVDEGSPRELIERHAPREVVEVRYANGVDIELALDPVRPHASRIEVLADRALLYTPDGDLAINSLQIEGSRPEAVLVRRSTLEDVFLILTGRSLED
jgi:lipooligosaccharide transport system ATP-binding protein